jgi:hypothetical protein
MAILSKSEYISYINGLLPDNSTQEISPQDLRLSLVNLADSVGELLVGVNIDSENFSTPEIRTTKAGDLSLSKLRLAGRSSEDNSAFGYYSLGGNYNGIRNTAIGSNSLGCNLYGSHNTAIGFNSLAANLIGSGNVGVGNHTLQLNKNGHFNIAIGHAAGYYIGENDSYKLYIAAHPVDVDSLCGAVSGSGADPLLHGDLKDIKLGIGTKTLDNFGTLQVSGSITPVQNSTFNLGHGSRSWKSLYLSSGISYTKSNDFSLSVLTPVGEPYPDQYTQETVAIFTDDGKIGFGTSTPSGSQGLMTVNGNIVPTLDGAYRLGSEHLKWDAYLNDVVISGRLYANDIDITQVNICAYDCKTLHLASSGLCGEDIIGDSFCGFLTDEQLDGAGFEIHSSGDDYKRDYEFLFYSSDPSLKCLEEDSVYSRSNWYSNISLHIESGRHVQTDRIISNAGNVSIVSQSGCYGLFIKPSQPSGNVVYLGSEDHIKSGYAYETNINFIGASGENDLIVSYSSPSSGVTVAQRFATRVSGDMRGFGLEYNDSLTTSGRLSTQIYNGQDNTLEAVTVLRNSNPNYGLFGITNIEHSGTPILPATIFNVQGSDGVEARFSTKSISEKVKLQLLGNGNTKASGLQVTYNPLYDDNQGSGVSENETIVDFDLIRSTNIESGVMSFTENGYVGIGNHHINDVYYWNATDPLTINHRAQNSGTIALKEQASAPSYTSDFGKIYVKPDITGGKTQSIYFLDDVGNESKITNSILNSLDGLLYGDVRGNTYGGWDSPNIRPTNLCYNNTAIGYSSLKSVFTGSANIAIGSGALESLTVGKNNVVIGSSFKQTSSGSGNIVIGNSNLETSTSNPINCIIIGTGISNTGTIDNYTLAIGFGGTPLIEGSMNPSSRNLHISNAKFSVSSEGNHQEIGFHTDLSGGKYQSYLDILQNDTTNNIFNGQFNLSFVNTYNQHYTLMKFDHSHSPMTNTTNYAAATSPYAELKGDLRLQGSIRFADGTSVNSAEEISVLDGVGITITSGAVNVDFTDVENAETYYPSFIDMDTTYVPVSLYGTSSYITSKLSLAALSERLQSGIPAIGNNCNAIFTNAENSIDRSNNKNTVFIGCDVGIGATGWKHSIMIGTHAGYGATTPNAGLNTDTASTFIGYRAGKDADDIDNCVFIGSSAGEFAAGADDSVFIGTSVGYKSAFSNSIGIGKFALSSSGANQAGSKNIEIVAGLLNSERLLYGTSNYSNKINIQNCIAGDSSLRRISIGDAVITPDAPLSVRKDDTIVGHSTSQYIQTWHCNDELAAGINCKGEIIASNNGTMLPNIIEGYMQQEVLAPISDAMIAASGGTSGILTRRDENWVTQEDVYIFNKDLTLNIHYGAYVIAQKVNGRYTPTWISCSGA